jgi:cellulose synthase/poly-beta-1,6-N-acetylglucosamine synthase-like glycosyltransferase
MSEPSRPDSPSASLQARGFFAALFDFNFRSFITLKFLKVIYAVVMTLILLGGVFFLISGLSRGGFTAILSLIGVPLVTLLYLVFARIYLEIIALLFRIGENTTIMAQSVGGRPGPMNPPDARWGTPNPPRE